MDEWTPSAGTRAGKPPLIGLTGPIGCGKSTVARMLGELGGSVIDADELARRATRSGALALAPIRARFGAEVFDAQGDLDRAALAGVVFEDEAALRDLEAILHPEVSTLVNLELERAAAADAPFTVVEAIKLVEGGLVERCDQVWIIDCAPATQRVRLAERGADAADIERRVAAQGPDLADALAARIGEPARVRRISTESGLEDTRARVEDALAEFLAEALDIG